MAWRSIIPEKSMEDVKQDRKSAVSVEPDTVSDRSSVGYGIGIRTKSDIEKQHSIEEKYKVSDKAIYVQGEYLPISVIKNVRVQSSIYSPNCCCGKGIPVFKIRIDYGAEKPFVLMLEKEKNAEKMISIITSANDSITIESGTEKKL